MKFFLQACRGRRPRDIELCLADAVQFFSTLRDLNPDIFRWKERANSKAAAMKRPNLDLDDPDVMRRLLLKGRNRNDVGREVIEDLGFRISLWNGAMVETSAASISLLNGCYSPRISNVLYLGFPGFGDLERNDELARRLVDAARSVLDPDWVMLGREIDDPRERPFLDRAMFLSSRLPLKLLAAFPLRWRGANVTSVKSGKIFLRKMEVAS